MFAVETLPSQYCEERAAAEAARRLAEQQANASLEARAKAPVAAQQSAPSSLSHALYQSPPQHQHQHPQPPPLTRAGSATVLGSIFQNFMKQGPSSPGVGPSSTPVRAQTPVSIVEQQRKDAEALLAERKRDTDICALPGWH